MRAEKAASVVLVCAALFLSGCEAGGLALSAASTFDLYDYFQGDSNLMEKNYAAAEYMADRARTFIGGHTRIQALPFLDEQEPRLVTKFGKELPEQIAERLIQLGYNVDMTAVSTGVEPAYQTPPLPTMRNPEFTLTGSYSRDSGNVVVRMRIQETGTGRERASFQYILPHRGNVRRDIKAEPTIEQIVQPVPDNAPNAAPATVPGVTSSPLPPILNN